MVLGVGSTAYGQGSVALWRSTAGSSTMVATATSYAFAAGTSTASGDWSVAMGKNAKAEEDNTFAFGGTVASDHTGSVALGYGSVTG